jgi:hypothetical protein
VVLHGASRARAATSICSPCSPVVGIGCRLFRPVYAFTGQVEYNCFPEVRFWEIYAQGKQSDRVPKRSENVTGRRVVLVNSIRGTGQREFYRLPNYPSEPAPLSA